MSDLAGSKGKQPVKALQPSGLRNEIHQESTDDERAHDQSYVQVPDSDIVIPETQLENDQLSPNSRTLLERTHVSKPQNAVEPYSFTVKLLSKADLQANPQTSSGFSFSPAHPVVPKKAVKDEAIAPQTLSKPVAVDTALEPVIEPAATAHVDLPQQEQSLPCPGKHTKRDGQMSKGPSNLTEMRKEPQVVSRPPGEVSAAGNTVVELSRASTGDLLEADAARPPSAQPGPSSATNMKRIQPAGKNDKKPRKGKRLKQRAEPWPPRHHDGKRPANPMEPLNFELPILDVMPTDASHRDVIPLDVVPNLPTDHASFTSHDEHISPIPNQRTSSSAHRAPPLENDEHINRAPKERTDSPPTIRNGTHDANYLARGMPQNEGPETKSMETVLCGGPMSSARNIPTEKLLHEVSSRAGPGRVAKTKKKPRTAEAPHASVHIPVNNGHSHRSFSNFEHAIQMVRASHVAEKVIDEHIHASQAKAQQDTIAALQETNSLQKDTIQALRTADMGIRAKLNWQSDKAKELQKYVKGVETDHAKFKTIVDTYYRESKKEWEGKIAEVEAQKASWEFEFLTTVEALSKTQRKMKAAMEECFKNLQISEDKQKALMRNLLTQSCLLDAEKKKREDLQQQIMSSLQVIQHRLEDNNGVLLERLGSIQTSVDDTTTDEKQNACLKECMNALKTLQATPLLAVKDVQKAEGMLRFVHESINSKLGRLSSSVEETTFPTKDLQNYIHDQLQSLRVEFLKYDEVAKECQKARQSNEHLNHQLEAQKEHCEKLDERIKSLLQSEADLKAHSSQLELEVKSLKDKALDLDSEPLDLEPEIIGLRGQLRKAEDDLQVAIEKLNTAETPQQAEESAAANWKKVAEEQQAKYAELAKKVVKNRKGSESFADMRAKMDKECRKRIQENEAALANDIHRLTRERDEKQDSLQKAGRELDATRDALQRAQQQLRNTESDAKELRKDKTDAELKLKKAQRTGQEISSASSELANLKEQLKQKNDAFQAKEHELSTLRQEHTALRSQATALQESVDQFQVQLSEYRSTIESMRWEVDTQLAEKREKEQATLQEAQNKIRSLEKQKQDLVSSLELSRSNAESSLKDTQAKFFLERERLREEIIELQAAKQSNEQELKRMRKDAIEELKKSEGKFRTEIDDLQCRLTQSDAALKESEASARRIEVQKAQELETHKRVATQKISEKMTETYNQKLNEAVLRHDEANKKKNREQSGQNIRPRGSSQTRSSRPSSIILSTPSKSLQNIHAGKPRKVIRESNSGLGVERPAHAQRSPSLGRSTPQVEQDHEKLDVVDSSSTDELGAREQLDEYGVSIVEPAPEVVPETQEMVPITSFQQFNQTLSQSLASARGKTRSSSSCLSDPDPDMISMLEHERRTPPTGPMSVTRRPSVKEFHSQSNDIETPSRATQKSAYDPRSHDRPRSRANTASRMAPPLSQLQFFDQANQGRVNTAKPGQPLQSLSQQSNRGSVNEASSPDYVHRPSSGTKVTYGYHAGRSTSSNTNRRDGASGVEDRGSSHKRKSSASHTERSMSSKRSITSSIPKSYQPRPLGSSGVVYNSQSQVRSSPQSAVAGSGSRSSRPPRSKSGRYDLRFSQELGE